jgi:hypothetical protein
MAQQAKRSRKYRKENRKGPKYQIDSGKQELQEKVNKKEIERAGKPDTLDVSDYEDFD